VAQLRQNLSLVKGITFSPHCKVQRALLHRCIFALSRSLFLVFYPDDVLAFIGIKIVGISAICLALVLSSYTPLLSIRERNRLSLVQRLSMSWCCGGKVKGAGITPR
jgi:hypothetical protein